jgi:hypothetical protein
MSNICPKGHFSSDIDYCSECGAPIASTRSSNTKSSDVAPTATSQQTVDNCPDCMTPRRTGAKFCEVCRYDFEKQMSFNGLQSSAPVIVPDTPAPPIPVAVMPLQAAKDLADTTTSANTFAISATRLKLKITVDSSLYTEPDPDLPCPVGTPAKEFHLDMDENTLGRQFEGKGIHPEIVVHDPGVSRRHLKFIRDDAGNFSVLELGSANGTNFNQTTLEAGLVTPLKAGDQLTLGMWTRIAVETR